MKGTRAAIRYAKSLLDLSIEQKKADTVKGDMLLVEQTIHENRDLTLLLKSPIVKADQKQAVLKAIFADKVDELTSSFIRIIVSKGRENILAPISSAFLAQYKIQHNIASAEVISAVPMSDSLRKKVLTLIKDSEQREVEMKEIVDPEIIGGLIVRVGDKQVDASIARKISDLKQTFNKNPFIAEI